MDDGSMDEPMDETAMHPSLMDGGEMDETTMGLADEDGTTGGVTTLEVQSMLALQELAIVFIGILSEKVWHCN